MLFSFDCNAERGKQVSMFPLDSFTCPVSPSNVPNNEDLYDQRGQRDEMFIHNVVISVGDKNVVD